MKVDSLDELRAAFAEWRRAKKYAREPMPEGLVARARRAAKTHGVTAVVGATRVERTRLLRTPPTDTKGAGAASSKAKGARTSVPPYSRLELSAPSMASASGARPIAEVETRSGVTLRVFEETPEMLSLLSAACGFGGVR